jgi:hypothetical protein
MTTRERWAARRLSLAAQRIARPVPRCLDVGRTRWERDRVARAQAEAFLNRRFQETVIPALEEHHRQVTNTRRPKTQAPRPRAARTPRPQTSRQRRGSPAKAQAPPDGESDPEPALPYRVEPGRRGELLHVSHFIPAALRLMAQGGEQCTEETPPFGRTS